MTAPTLSHTVRVPDLVDTIIGGPENVVFVQAGDDLIGIDLRSGQNRVLAKIEPGSQLLAIDTRQRIKFDNSGNVVHADFSGAVIRTVSLGAEAELVAARQLGSRLILLLAESVGDALDLGVPHFGFVSLDEHGAVVVLTERWRKTPDLWFIDQAAGRLIVWPDIEAEPPIVVDAASADIVAPPAGLIQPYRRYRLTGMNITPDGQRLAVSLWNDESSRGELRVAPLNLPSNKLVRVFASGSGTPVDPAWAPDGQSLSVRMETTGGTALELASSNEDGEWQTARLTSMDPLGAYFWHGSYLIVQTDDAEIGVFELR